MGWFVALLVVLLLLLLPLGAIVQYDVEGLRLAILAGPIRIPILPAKKKDPQDAKPPKKKKNGQKQVTTTEKPKPREKGGSVKDFLPLVDTVLQFLNAFRKKLRIKRLEMKWIMAGDDPCDLAVNYGKAWTALGNLMPRLERVFVIKKRNLAVECDFEAFQATVIARVDATITLGWILVLVIRYGVRALKQYLNLKTKRKGGASK